MTAARLDGRGDEHLRALTAAISDVLGRLDAHAEARTAAGPAAGSAAAPNDQPGLTSTSDNEPVPSRSGPSALDTLCACFGLTAFERDLLVLAAAAEIDPRTAAVCAAASGSPELAFPTFGLGLAALDEPHWSALTPVAPLRRWLLITVEDTGALTASRVRIDERVLHFLLGAPYLDTRLHGLVDAAVRPDTSDALPASQRIAAQRIAAIWQRTDGDPRVEIVGADRQTRLEIAAHAAASCGLRLYAVRAAELPTDPTDRDVLARLWEREAVLLPAALLIDAADADEATKAEALLASRSMPFAMSSLDPLPALRVHRERVGAALPTADEQHLLWASTLNGTASSVEPRLRELVAQFSLPAHVIRAAGASVRRGADTAAAEDPGELLWQAGLAEARMGLADLGRRIEPKASWADLVLPRAQRVILREIVAHVRQRVTVYQDWGFDQVLRRGLGVTALLAGGSGTGKTLAAEVIAHELGLDLFVIDLSQVVSKFIGETEKNLRKVFDAAERGGALLLFDEADALFGKRSEVKDSHDRYANLEVSYLLMRMEEYRGLAILTTNMKKALDTAFMRRIRFVVEFPFPDVPERAEIWRRVIPAETPAHGLNPDLLAKLTVAGGSIRNIALAAAFLAADEGVDLQMRHVLAAAKTEYLKQERSLPPGEVAGWI